MTKAFLCNVICFRNLGKFSSGSGCPYICQSVVVQVVKIETSHGSCPIIYKIIGPFRLCKLKLCWFFDFVIFSVCKCLIFGDEFLVQEIVEQAVTSTLGMTPDGSLHSCNVMFI